MPFHGITESLGDSLGDELIPLFRPCSKVNSFCFILKKLVISK